MTDEPTPAAIGSNAGLGVRRLNSAGLAAKMLRFRALHDLVLALGSRPGSERCVDDLSREAAALDADIDGQIWSWVHSVMNQGANIFCDYDQGKHKTYEHYSASLDASAAERGAELMDLLKTLNDGH